MEASFLKKMNRPGNKINTAKPDSLAPESSCVFSYCLKTKQLLHIITIAHNAS